MNIGAQQRTKLFVYFKLTIFTSLLWGCALPLQPDLLEDEKEVLNEISVLFKSNVSREVNPDCNASSENCESWYIIDLYINRESFLDSLGMDFSEVLQPKINKLRKLQKKGLIGYRTDVISVNFNVEYSENQFRNKTIVFK